MRAFAGYLACMAVAVSVAAPPGEPSPIYLRGYYGSTSAIPCGGTPYNRPPVGLLYGGPR